MFKAVLDRLNSAAGPLALVALFIALGGAAYAVKKNSVGSPQIKNDSVKGTDIKDGGIKGKDIKDGSLKGKDIDDDKIEGAQIDEATLEGVDAETLGGREIHVIDEFGATAGPGIGNARTALDLGGLRILYYCHPAGNLYLGAHTDVDNAKIGATVINAHDLGSANEDHDNDLDVGQEFELQIGAKGADVDDAMTHVTYWNEEGSVVTAQIWTTESIGGTCTVKGHAIG